jgi:predicted N-acyltransferase
MRLEYLRALHASGSASDETGWQAQFLLLRRGGAIVAACPLYLKAHSYGEYVFDWAWADAYRRHRLRYYPKLLDAVPFTPVPGPRLLARTQADRQLLLQAMQQFAREAKLSSAHLLFLDDADQAAARASGWMMRSTVHFIGPTGIPHPTRTSRTSSPACSARSARRSSRSAPGRRSRRHVRGEGAAPRSPRPIGTFSIVVMH